MMKQDKDFVGELLENVSKRIGKPFKYLIPFGEELKKNWYDTPQALTKATDAEFQKMNIPLRVAIAIREELGVNLQPIKKDPPQQNKEQLLGKANKNQSIPVNQNKVTQSSMLNSIIALQVEVMKKYPWVGEQLIKIFQTLLKIIKNILGDPYQLKFRVLKKSNAKIKEIIVDNQPVVIFLKQLGFQENKQTLTLHKFQIHQLYFIQQGLQNVLHNHRTQSNMANNSQQPKKTLQERSPFLPANIKFPQNKQSATLQNAFSKEQLQQANYADILDKLMEYRNKLMATPPTKRLIRIYHKRFQVRETNFLQCDLQKQMQNSDNQVLAKYWKNVLKMSRSKTHFQSRRKNQFEFLVKQKIYKQTIIKVRLPNELVIQARFGPLQTLRDVLELVAIIVVGDIYLYQSPPVKRLDKLLYQTLQNMDSVPTGTFYLGINHEWHIKNQYATFVQH